MQNKHQHLFSVWGLGGGGQWGQIPIFSNFKNGWLRSIEKIIAVHDEILLICFKTEMI